MPIFGWEQGEVQASDPPHVHAAEKHLSDGRPGWAFLWLVLMGAGVLMFFAVNPIGGLVVFGIAGLMCLVSMPRTIRRLALALVALAVVGWLALIL